MEQRPDKVPGLDFELPIETTVVSSHRNFEPALSAPEPFGYKMGWIAVRSRDAGAVAEAAGTGELAEGLGVVGVVTSLSAQFGEAQGFATHRVVEYAPPLDRGAEWAGDTVFWVFWGAGRGPC